MRVIAKVATRHRLQTPEGITLTYDLSRMLEQDQSL